MPGLAVLRLETANTAAAAFASAAQSLNVLGQVVGPDRPAGSSARGYGSDETVAVGIVAQTASELVAASAPMLGGDQQYAGAALLRQLVEVEYLAWVFSTGSRDAKVWLDSSSGERWKTFRPKILRDISSGLFRSEDYSTHCEQGGHPTPEAASLLGGRNKPLGQLLLVDLLLHTWRTWDSLVRWAVLRSVEPIIAKEAAGARSTLAAWGEADPLYQMACHAGGPRSDA